MNIDALYNLTHGVYVLGADDGRPAGRQRGGRGDAGCQQTGGAGAFLPQRQLYQKLH